jgi:hypothetical protein
MKKLFFVLAVGFALAAGCITEVVAIPDCSGSACQVQ